MAQLRHDYPQFKALNAEVLVMLPNGPKLIEWYVKEHHNPYPILSDKGARAAGQYSIDTKRIVGLSALTIFTPSVFLVDQTGTIRYTNYSTSYISEPDNREPLSVLAG
jgi:peroxiredoxin